MFHMAPMDCTVVHRPGEERRGGGGGGYCNVFLLRIGPGDGYSVCSCIVLGG